VGIIHYNHRAYLDWNFKSDVAENAIVVKQEIKKLKYHPGGTRTDRAMDMASSQMFDRGAGARPNAPHVLLVITDGKTSKRSKPYKDVLKPLLVIKKQTKTK